MSSSEQPPLKTVLDFEKPIADLEARIHELQAAAADANIDEEIDKLKQRSQEMTSRIFSRLTPWQVSQLARHPHRPFTLDYVHRLFHDVHELHGDRYYADDPAIVCGLARLDGTPIAFVGHQKGRSTKDNLLRNFGMPRPEGYRKALRIMELADRFGLPIITFIDTQGAFPGIDAEERGQSEAIARNLRSMAVLRCPVIAIVIGEGGSGGALAIGVADRLLMLQFATYSVISPEGCASILWQDARKAPDAANVLGLTSDRLHGMGLVDRVIPEPLGGAHRDHELAAATLKSVLKEELAALSAVTEGERLAERQARYLRVGQFETE